MRELGCVICAPSFLLMSVILIQLGFMCMLTVVTEMFCISWHLGLLKLMPCENAFVSFEVYCIDIVTFLSRFGTF